MALTQWKWLVITPTVTNPPSSVHSSTESYTYAVLRQRSRSRFSQPLEPVTHSAQGGIDIALLQLGDLPETDFPVTAENDHISLFTGQPVDHRFQ